MAKLSKHVRLALQGLWLAHWKMAGRPSLGPVIDNNIILSPQALNITVLGKAQQTHGVASRLRVTLGHVVMTRLVSQLGGRRLSKDDTINVRTGAGEWHDIQTLARLALDIHIEAAVALTDHDAMRAANYIPPVIKAEHEALLAETLPGIVQCPVQRL